MVDPDQESFKRKARIVKMSMRYRSSNGDSMSAAANQDK